MRGIIVALVSVVILLVSVTDAAAQRVDFKTVTIELTPERFGVQLVGSTLEGADADALRASIDDEFGDGDGIVVAAEVDAYVAAKTSDYNSQLGLFGSELTKGVLVDDRPPTRIVITDITLDGAVGAAASNATITRDFSAELIYTETARTTVNVTFSQDFRKTLPTMTFETATFKTVQPWRIDATSITPGGQENTFWEDDHFMATYGDMDAFSDVDNPLSFDLTADPPAAKDKKKDSPAVTASPLILGVLLLALIAAPFRRRD